MRQDIINHYSAVRTGVKNKRGEVFTKPSLTVPDMTLSLKELLARYVRGQDVKVYEPVYTDNPDLPPSYERMDEVERLEAARELKGIVETKLEQFREKVAARANKQKDSLENPPGD